VIGPYLRLTVGDPFSRHAGEKDRVRYWYKYQLTIAKLPLAKDLDDFQFEGTPINETLVHDLAGGGFIAQRRNAVLVGGTGTGKTHLASAIARSCIAPAPVGGSTTSSTLLTGSRPRPAAVARAGLPII